MEESQFPALNTQEAILTTHQTTARLMQTQVICLSLVSRDNLLMATNHVWWLVLLDVKFFGFDSATATRRFKINYLG